MKVKDLKQILEIALDVFEDYEDNLENRNGIYSINLRM